MPFTAPTSPTSGLANYDLEGQRPRGSRPSKAKRRRGALRLVPFLKLQPSEASMNEYEKLLKALFGSVMSVPTTASADERTEHLTKAFQDFDGELAKMVQDVRLDAFDCGVRGDLRKFHGADGAEEEGVDHVADMSQIVRSVTGAVELMKGDNMSEPVQQAVGLWADMGRTVLSTMISEVEANDGSLAKSERNVNQEQLKKNLDEVNKLALMLRKRAKTLTKDIGDGSDSGDVSDMDPLEVIGRLAAAILVQIDALMGDDGQGDGTQDDGSQDDGTAQDDELPEGNEGGGDGAGAAKAAPGGDLNKSAPVAAAPAADPALAKLTAENEELKKQLAKANAAPADTVGKPAPALTVVEKTGDGVTPLSKGAEEVDLEKEAERLAKMSPEARSTEFMKIALRRPVRVA